MRILAETYYFVLLRETISYTGNILKGVHIAERASNYEPHKRIVEIRIHCIFVILTIPIYNPRDLDANIHLYHINRGHPETIKYVFNMNANLYPTKSNEKHS